LFEVMVGGGGVDEKERMKRNDNVKKRGGR
jgi:hypothetical protein